MKLSKWNIALLVIVILGIIFLLFLKFSSEDTWICKEGIWQKHGNPSAPQPTTQCK